MEVLASGDEIILEAEARMLGLGSEVAQRMMEGKDSVEQLTQGKKILSVKRAYRADLDDKEKEALLYCLRDLSDAYAVAALTSHNILDSIIPDPEPDEPFVDFYIGSLADAEGYIGTGSDTSNAIGTK